MSAPISGARMMTNSVLRECACVGGLCVGRRFGGARETTRARPGIHDSFSRSEGSAEHRCAKASPHHAAGIRFSRHGRAGCVCVCVCGSGGGGGEVIHQNRVALTSTRAEISSALIERERLSYCSWSAVMALVTIATAFFSDSEDRSSFRPPQRGGPASWCAQVLRSLSQTHPPKCQATLASAA